MFDVLPRLLSRFVDLHPQVKLVLHHDATPAQVTALRQGRVLLVFERMLPNEPDIEVEMVTRERVVVALHTGHRLAAKKVIDMATLRNEPMIMPAAPLSQLANVALDLCRANGFEPKVAQLGVRRGDVRHDGGMRHGDGAGAGIHAEPATTQSCLPPPEKAD